MRVNPISNNFLTNNSELKANKIQNKQANMQDGTTFCSDIKIEKKIARKTARKLLELYLKIGSKIGKLKKAYRREGLDLKLMRNPKTLWSIEFNIIPRKGSEYGIGDMNYLGDSFLLKRAKDGELKKVLVGLPGRYTTDQVEFMNATGCANRVYPHLGPEIKNSQDVKGLIEAYERDLEAIKRA